VTKDGDRLRERAERAVLEWLHGVGEDGVAHEVGARPGELVLQLPGEHKLRTTVSVLIGERSLSASAFVVRHPDENADGVHRWLLARNLRLQGAAFAIDGDGDVYIVGRIPLEGVTPTTVDALMGVIGNTADTCFDELLALGFLTSMKKEWAWRVSRGESTRNLEAFRHLLDDQPPTTPSR
jgi:Putative bacterial sensory transduction regulator